jgi:cold shock CspA family protein
MEQGNSSVNAETFRSIGNFYEGVVRSFNHDKGFGFVSVPAIDNDVFLHAKVVLTCQVPIEKIEEGQKVRVRCRRNPKGKGFQVTSIRLAQK